MSVSTLRFDVAFALILTLTLAGCGILPIGEGANVATMEVVHAEETSLAVQRGILTQQVVYSTRHAPTGTPSPAPTMTPSASPTPTVLSPMPTTDLVARSPEDPALTFGPPHDRDVFDGEGGMFLPSDNGVSRATVRDGRYVVEFDSRGRWTWYWSFLDAGDFYVDLVVIQGAACVEEDAAGLLFRGNASRDEAYVFGVNCAGEYFIELTSSPGAEGSICTTDYGGSVNCRYQHWEPDEGIQAGAGAMNRLGVYAVGGHLDFYVNGIWLESREVGDFSDEWQYWRGNIAVFLRSAQINQAQAAFDDFNIWYFE